MALSRFGCLLAVATVVFFASCKKDDTPKFTEDQLTVNDGWSIVAIETNLEELAPLIVASIPDSSLGFFTRDFLESLLVLGARDQEQIEACEADDVYTFKVDGTMGYSNSGTICDTSDPNTSADAIFGAGFKWELRNGNKLILTDSNSDSTEFTILTLNTTNLIIESRVPFEDEDFSVMINENLVTKLSFSSN